MDEREDGQHIQHGEDMDGDSVDENGLEHVDARSVDEKWGLVVVVVHVVQLLLDGQ